TMFDKSEWPATDRAASELIGPNRLVIVTRQDGKPITVVQHKWVRLGQSNLHGVVVDRHRFIDQFPVVVERVLLKRWVGHQIEREGDILSRQMVAIVEVDVVSD